MDANIVVPLAVLITGTVITLSVVSIVQFTKARLKSEQIKADAMVKAEEIRAKNQLEIERLIHSHNASDNKSANNPDFSCDNRTVREKQR